MGCRGQRELIFRVLVHAIGIRREEGAGERRGWGAIGMYAFMSQACPGYDERRPASTLHALKSIACNSSSMHATSAGDHFGWMTLTPTLPLPLLRSITLLSLLLPIDMMVLLLL